MDQGGELIRFIAVFATAALLAGCRNPPAEPTITRDQFVDVIVQLRQADSETDDAGVFDARKAEILGDAGVTDSMLLAYARVHGDDIALMAEVWDTIARRLVRADTLPR